MPSDTILRLEHMNLFSGRKEHDAWTNVFSASQNMYIFWKNYFGIISSSGSRHITGLIVSRTEMII